MAQLIPEFADSVNPYLRAAALQRLSEWGFPEFYYPASPIGFAAYPSDLATQYVTGLPAYFYSPSFLSSLSAFVQEPLETAYTIPYATSAEQAFHTTIALADASISSPLLLVGAIGSVAAGFALESVLSYPLVNAIKSLPIIGAPIPVIEKVGSRVLSTILRRPVSGAAVSRFLIGLPIAYTLGSAAFEALIGPLVIDPLADVISGLHDTRAALARVGFGAAEYSPFLGTIEPETAGDVYRELLKIWEEMPHLELSQVEALLTVGSQVGLFDLIGPNKERILNAIKSLASFIDVLSEIARDPSIADTLRNLGQLTRLGLTPQTALQAYRQLALLSTATGVPLSAVYPELLQAGAAFTQVFVSPLTGIQAAAEARLYGHELARLLTRQGQELFVSAMGGQEGIAAQYQQFMMRLPEMPIFTMEMLFGGGMETGRLGRLDFTGGVRPEDYARLFIFRPELMEELRERYGPEGLAHVMALRALESLQAVAPGLSPEMQALWLAQMGFPMTVVRAVATGGEEALLEATLEAERRRRLAESMEQANLYERRTLSLWGRLTKEGLRRGLLVPVREAWTDFVSGLQQELYEFRVHTRYAPEGTIERWIGELLWGVPRPELGGTPGMVTHMVATASVAARPEEILAALSQIETLREGGMDALEAQVAATLMHDYSRRELRRFNLERAVQVSPMVARLEERGVSFRGLTFREAMGRVKETLGISSLEEIPVEERPAVISYIAWKFMQENQLDFKEATDEQIRALLQVPEVAVDWTSAVERIEELRKPIRETEIELLSASAGEITPKKHIVDVIERGVLSTMQGKLEEVDYELIRAAVKVSEELAEYGTIRTEEGSRSLALLKKRGVIPEDLVLKAYTEREREQWRKMAQYGQELLSGIATLKEETRRQVIHEQIKRGITSIVGEEFAEETYEVARELLLTYAEAIKDQTITPQEVRQLEEKATPVRENLMHASAFYTKQAERLRAVGRVEEAKQLEAKARQLKEMARLPAAKLSNVFLQAFQASTFTSEERAQGFIDQLVLVNQRLDDATGALKRFNDELSRTKEILRGRKGFLGSFLGLD